MNKYNLIDENWIPTTLGMKSIRQLVNSDEDAFIGRNAMETLCLYKFLQAISIAATDGNILTNLNEFRKSVNAYLDKCYDLFWLYSDEHRPFLQFPELRNFNVDSENFNIDLRKLVYWKKDCSANAVLVSHSDRVEEMSDAEKAILLLISIGYCLNSKDAFGKNEIVRTIRLTDDEKYLKYSKKDGTESANNCIGLFTGNNSGVLHGLVFKDTIIKTMQYSQIDVNDIEDYSHKLCDHLGIAPWEYENLTENCDYKTSIYSLLLPMNRFMLLGEANKAKIVEGINHFYKGDTFNKNQPSVFKYSFEIKEKNDDKKKIVETIQKTDSTKNPFLSLATNSVDINSCKAINYSLGKCFNNNEDGKYTIWVGGISLKDNTGLVYFVNDVKSFLKIDYNEEKIVDFTTKLKNLNDNIDIAVKNMQKISDILKVKLSENEEAEFKQNEYDKIVHNFKKIYDYELNSDQQIKLFKKINIELRKHYDDILFSKFIISPTNENVFEIKTRKNLQLCLKKLQN